MLRWPTLKHRLVVALVAAAVAVLGFGPIPAADEPPLDPLLAAYVQTGGSLDDLCRTGDPRDGDPAQGQHCPLCLPAPSFALAVPPVLALPSVRPVAVAAVPEMPHLTSGHAPRAPPARGPPVSLV